MSAASVEAPEHPSNTDCVIHNTPNKERGTFDVGLTCDLVNTILVWVSNKTNPVGTLEVQCPRDPTVDRCATQIGQKKGRGSTEYSIDDNKHIKNCTQSTKVLIIEGESTHQMVCNSRFAD